MANVSHLFKNLYSIGLPVFKGIIKYRYVIALILFIILVACKVNGSSISMYGNQLITGSDQPGTLLGNPRPIRSDEWSVQTPYYIAQANSPTPYSLKNNNISLSGQNMIVSYGAPVWDVSTLAKPLNWGFLLLGPAYGLAWYWTMKVLLLLLLSFELCLIVTKRHVGISVLGALWIALSPAIQWWFMQHVGDITFYFEAVVVSFYYFFRHFKNLWYKLAYALLFSLSSVGFVLTVYPAIQVPFLYLGLLLCGLILSDQINKIHFKLTDYVIIVSSFILIAGLLLHVYLISRDAFTAILNTAYPGHRVSDGGEGQWFNMYQFLTNPFLPYKDISGTNNCEISTFYQFFPAAFAAIVLLFKKKWTNFKYGIVLLIFSLISLLYLNFKIPVFIAKLTLLSFVTYRVQLAFAFAALLLSVWLLAELSRGDHVKQTHALLLSIIIAASYIIAVHFPPLSGYVRFRYYFILICLFALLNFLLLTGKKRLFSLLMLTVILFSGATVNPVNIGTGNMFSNSLTSAVKKIKKQDPAARWIALGNSDMGSYLAAIGLKDLDGTNYYPDRKKWKLLDPSNRYVNIYNRYAHVNFSLTTAKQISFSLLAPDSIQVNITASDLKKLNVRYILSPAVIPRPTGFAVEQVCAQKTDGYYIYKVR
ncbi:MAG: hypothetical protein ABF868_11815 [Sporolactobacillus sp.]